MDPSDSSLAETLWPTPPPQAEGVLAEFLRAAEAAWPSIKPRRAGLVAHIGNVSTPTSLEDLASLHGAELWLAYACLQTDPAALQLLDARYLVRTSGAIARVDTSADFIDEVQQQTRERLLLGERPRLSEYQGRGPLAAWLKTVSVRLALSLKRSAPPREAAEPDLELAGGLTSVGLVDRRILGERYAAAFTLALGACLKRLAERERAVLRLHYVERQSVDRIGALYGVHRATAARWVAAARSGLHQSLLAYMCDEVGVPKSELASLVAGITSQIDLSLGSALKD